VKPSNILISSINTETKDEIVSPYAWNFKLADLGLSHFKPTEDGNTDQDSQGTITYGLLKSI
jgi:serine/threonine protein kinase